MVDWDMASPRLHQSQQSLTDLAPERERLRVRVSWPTTSMGSQPVVQDNESTDPHLSSDGKI
jgi:hypothetical protein